MQDKKKNEHHKEDKSQQGPAVICLMNTSARPSAAERLRPLCCSSSLPPPPHPTPASSQALWRTALSLWTDYRQLKVWQHLKLSPHVANDFPSTDITFNASAAVISIRRTGWDKRSQKNKREKRGWVGVWGGTELLMALDNHATFSNTCNSLTYSPFAIEQRLEKYHNNLGKNSRGYYVTASLQRQKGWGLSRQQL